MKLAVKIVETVVNFPHRNTHLSWVQPALSTITGKL